MNLFAAVKALFPTAADDDFALWDESDGTGPYLALWHEAKLGPAPTTATLKVAAAALPPAPTSEPAPAKPTLIETDDLRAKRGQRPG